MLQYKSYFDAIIPFLRFVLLWALVIKVINATPIYFSSPFPPFDFLPTFSLFFAPFKRQQEGRR